MRTTPIQESANSTIHFKMTFKTTLYALVSIVVMFIAIIADYLHYIMAPFIKQDEKGQALQRGNLCQLHPCHVPRPMRGS